MSHVVTSSHHITLKSGRQVHPGQEVSDKEAAKNPQLVERGDLTPRPEEGAEKTPPTPKRRRSKAPASGSVPNKEDQK